MVAVLASEVREKGGPRTPPFLALLASIAAHAASICAAGMPAAMAISRSRPLTVWGESSRPSGKA